MTELIALRLYFPLSAKASATRFWHKFSAPNLAQHLLAFARRANIQQAILHHVSAGYLPGEKLSHHMPDGGSMKHPQCLELIDTEEKIRRFLHEHEHELHKVRLVLFRCELPVLKPTKP
jgi:PII-like signaling protein